MKRILTSLFFIIFTAGCLRGESRSLDEVFIAAKDRYAEASKTELPPEVSQTMERVVVDLDKIAAGNSSDSLITEVLEGLSALLPHAGYTVRPALTEIRNQYVELLNGDDPSQQELRLLAARTFSTLEEELQGSRFSIEP